MTKQLSIRELPPVLSVQFKVKIKINCLFALGFDPSLAPQRFEYPTADKTAAKKIDTRVRFPATISMAPYTTFVVSGGTKGPKSKAKAAPPEPFP